MALPEMPCMMEHARLGTEDRRLAERCPVRLACWCEAAERDLYVRCLDLGRDGLFLQTLVELPPGARVDLRLQLPEGEFSAQAEVMWRRAFEDHGPPPGLGLQFLAVDEKSLDILDIFIESHRA